MHVMQSVCVCVCVCMHRHRHRIDKYPVSRYLTCQSNILEGEATNHCQKGTSQDGGLPELLLAQSCLTNHSEAGRRKSPIMCHLL